MKPGDAHRALASNRLGSKNCTKALSSNPAFGNRRIIIDTVERTLEIRENNTLIYEFPITPGSTKLPAPKGCEKFPGIATLPWFRHDEGVLNYGVRTENYFNLPPGPNNPVGILWMGLNKPHVGIHGTNNPETIGRAGKSWLRPYAGMGRGENPRSISLRSGAWLAYTKASLLCSGAL